MTKAPKIIHFIYVGGRPFSFIHFLAVYTAWKVNNPERILFHHSEEPSGYWWECAKPYLQLNKVEPVREIFGNPVKYRAHQADVIRLQMLRKFGGIYLDLDVLCINSLDPLLRHPVTMGIEPGVGLCNAVIIAQPDADFLQRWFEEYRSFNGELWNHHAVVLPWKLALQIPAAIHVENQYAFFYPSHNDPVHRYLWGERPSVGAVLSRAGKNVIKSSLALLHGERDPVKRALYGNYHVLRGPDWHFRQLQKSYCLHLWEGLWGDRYLSKVTPAFVESDGCQFARLIRCILEPRGIREISGYGSRAPAPGPDIAHLPAFA